MMSMLQLQQAIIPVVQTAADTDSCTRVSAMVRVVTGPQTGDWC